MSKIELTDTFGNELTLSYGQYGNGRWAIKLLSESMPYATLTVNVPDAELLPNEVVIKTYSENAMFADHVVYQLVSQNVIKRAEDGKNVKVGHAVCPVFTLVPGPVPDAEAPEGWQAIGPNA